MPPEETSRGGCPPVSESWTVDSAGEVMVRCHSCGKARRLGPQCGCTARKRRRMAEGASSQVDPLPVMKKSRKPEVLARCNANSARSR
jgi:hypothetical protein